MQRGDQYRNFRFRVIIQGITIACFSEASIPDSTTDPIEYIEGLDSTNSRKLSCPTRYENLTLKNGITDSMDLYNWRGMVEDFGRINTRRNISIVLVDEEGNNKLIWDIFEAWPTKYSSSGFDEKGYFVVIDTFELAFEKITRMK